MFCDVLHHLGLEVILNVIMEGLDMVGVNQYGGYSDSPSETSNVHSISGRDDFLTEDEARNYIIGEATRWIDGNRVDEPQKVLQRQ